MNFTCPYCNHVTTITDPNKYNLWEKVAIKQNNTNYDHDIGVGFLVIACPNQDCKELTVTSRLTGSKSGYNQMQGSFNAQDASTIYKEWRLVPDTDAKPQPNYIPKQLVQDYTEACKIRDLSPKASATLARRCLQGMIRDFHGVKDKKSLYDEIDALKGAIPVGEWDALDSLRSIGNIGAHMEKDVDLIIDVTPDEANTLIAFIEYLFKQWYVKRHDDEENLRAVKAIAGIKKAQKKPAPEKAE